MLFEKYVKQKINDVRFAKIPQRYEVEQSENAKKIKAIELELRKSEGRQMDVDTFLKTVRRYRNHPAHGGGVDRPHRRVSCREERRRYDPAHHDLETHEKIALFHAGASAFLEKPLDVELCIAQANALIKLYLKSDKELGKSIPITFGSSLVIAPRYRKVLLQGTPIELTRIEFDLLYFMARHPGQVFSRKELYDYVWDDYYELGGDETVKSHIKALRKKRAGLGRDVIETVWAVGYRFIPPE